MSADELGRTEGRQTQFSGAGGPASDAPGRQALPTFGRSFSLSCPPVR